MEFRGEGRDIQQQFVKKLNTPNTGSLLNLAIIFAVITAFITIANTRTGLAFGGLFFLVLGYQVLTVILKPKVILISDEEIEVGDKVITWNKVLTIRFDRPIYKPISLSGYESAALLDIVVPNQIIELTLKNHNVIKIYPRIYSENKFLREEIERIAREIGINYSVRDRGLL